MTCFFRCVAHLSAVLHPKYKTKYFEKAGWESEWIEEAKRLVEDAYENAYAGRIPSDEFLMDESEIGTDVESQPVRVQIAHLVTVLMFFKVSENMFDDDDEEYETVVTSSLTFAEELDLYLHDPIEVPKRGLIAWWKDNVKKYPILSRMALDYHSIPGAFIYYSIIIYIHTDILSVATSTDVERIFSRGRLLLSHIRNRLSAQSTRAVLCLGYWSLLGFVKDKDVLAVTARKDDGKADLEAEDDGWDALLTDYDPIIID
jgi:hypothetical protein